VRIQFLGATGTVTGSKFHLTDGTHSWLIDCGLFQGLRDLKRRNWQALPIDERALEAVILTHAHIDHSGYLPVLTKNGFTGSILASEPSVELCKILLPDAGYLQEEDAKFASKKGFSRHKQPIPLYTYEDAIKTLQQLKVVPDKEWHQLSDNVRMMLRPSGHILGSRFINISIKEGYHHYNVMFAGDIGRYDSLLTSDPGAVKSVNYLVLESTYGNKEHIAENVFDRFEKIINETISRGGKVIIPAFAVNRTQEVLYILQELEKAGRLPDVPIYLNSPLAIDATAIYMNYLDEHDFFKNGSNGNLTEAAFHPSRLKQIHESEDSKKLNYLEEPAIILSSSGMLTGGRILHHLKAYLPDKLSTIVLTGFQAMGTKGRMLLDGIKSLNIHGSSVPVKAQLEHIESLSAHGDYKDIMRWLKGFRQPPKTTFLVHGEPESAQALKERIERELNWHVEIPKYMQKVEL